MFTRSVATVCAFALTAAFGPPVRSPAYVVPDAATEARGEACVAAPTPACLLIEIAARSYQLDPTYADPVRQELVAHARNLVRNKLADPTLTDDVARLVGVEAPAPAATTFMERSLPSHSDVWAQLRAWGFAETLAAYTAAFADVPTGRSTALAWRDLDQLLRLAEENDQPEVARTILTLAQPFHVHSDAMVTRVADWAVRACALEIFDAALAVDPARYEGWDRLVERARLTGDVSDAVWDAQWAEWEGGHGLVEAMTRGFRVTASLGFCPQPEPSLPAPQTAPSTDTAPQNSG